MFMDEQHRTWNIFVLNDFHTLFGGILSLWLGSMMPTGHAACQPVLDPAPSSSRHTTQYCCTTEYDSPVLLQRILETDCSLVGP